MEKPTLVQIESSTACDAKCVFCPRPKMKRKGGTMKESLFEKIVQESKKLGISELVLFLNGEPLIFPRLFDWLKRLRQEGLRTVIFTNANQLTTHKSIVLTSFHDVIQSIVFSIGGIDTETYKEVMGLNYDKVLGNIRKFAQINAGKINTKAHIPLMSMTQKFTDRWVDHWREYVDELSPTDMFNFGGLIKDDLELKESDLHVRKFCARLNHLTVLWDGRVCLCCIDAEGQVILGNVNKQTLSEIYNGDLAKRYRAKQSEGKYSDLPLCQDCNMNIVGV